MRKQVFLDIETTGLNPRTDTIKQIAGIYKENGIIKGRFDCKKNNTIFCLQQFLEKHISPFDKNDKAYLMGWNVKFDSEFIHNAFEHVKGRSFGNYMYHMPVDIQQICTFKFMQKGLKPDNFKLETVARFLKIPCITGNFHDGMYDIMITNEIYKKLLKL